MAANYKCIHRMLKIITLTQSGDRWTPTRLAQELNCTERTIYRDIIKLAEVDLNIEFDKDAGTYRARRDVFMQPVQLTLEESLALIALSSDRSGEQIPFTLPAAMAISKIRGQLPQQLRSQLEPLNGRLTIRLPQTTGGDGYSDIYQKVRQSIARSRVLNCLYEAPQAANRKGGQADQQWFLFKPYAIFFNERAWYVVGYHETRKAVRTLKLSRFADVKITDRPYLIPDDFSLESNLGDAWRMIRGGKAFDVELVFDKSFAEGISETRWHRTQETRFDEDGSLNFRAKVDGLDEIVWWVLSMGSHCHVVKPPELAARVKDMAEQVVKMYATEKTC